VLPTNVRNLNVVMPIYVEGVDSHIANDG